jgi:hypothetical protein
LLQGASSTALAKAADECFTDDERNWHGACRSGDDSRARPCRAVGHSATAMPHASTHHQTGASQAASTADPAHAVRHRRSTSNIGRRRRPRPRAGHPLVRRQPRRARPLLPDESDSYWFVPGHRDFDGPVLDRVSWPIVWGRC